LAGVLKVDTLQSDSNLALKIATANVAFIDSNGLNVVGGNLTIGATQFAEGGQIQTAGIADDAVTSDKILSVANTKISGLIQAAQIGSANASVINAGTLAKARLPSGSVLQVVQATFSTEDDISSVSYVASSITASITPSSASNKVLIFVSTTMQNTGNAVSCFSTLFRNATTNLGSGSETAMIENFSVEAFDVQPTQIMYLDSPSSTSSVAYAVYAKANSNNVRIGKGNIRSTIILMEIAG
jgi:hypothetical protein